MYTLMNREFPTFDQSTLPAIPAGWIDISWHNDVCPSFQVHEGLRVWIDFSAPADREFDGGFRFVVDCEEAAVVFATDSWKAVLEFVETGH